MKVAWPAGVRTTLRRDGYSRAVEDIVQRRAVETGPPLRQLAWPTPFQTLKGQLGLKVAEADTFETWFRIDLDHGEEQFDLVLYDHPSPRTVTARFTAPPQRSHASATTRLFAVEMQIDAPQPVTSELAALAALEDAGPAVWPGSLPAIPRRATFTSTDSDRVLRGNEAGPMVSRLATRQTGEEQQVSLAMTETELAAFETWWKSEAAYGVRDIAFPRAGGTHLGCFTSAYTVTGSTELAAFIITFTRYLEAIA